MTLLKSRKERNSPLEKHKKQLLSLYLGALDADSLGMEKQQKIQHPNTQALMVFYQSVRKSHGTTEWHKKKRFTASPAFQLSPRPLCGNRKDTMTLVSDHPDILYSPTGHVGMLKYECRVARYNTGYLNKLKFQVSRNNFSISIFQISNGPHFYQKWLIL